MIVVADTSPINNLLKINHVDILPKLYNTIILLEKVLEELIQDTTFLNWYNEEEIKWIKVIKVEEIETDYLLRFQLDAGETAAIALANKLHADILLIDETQGRLVANSLGIRTTGVLGVLLEAKQRKVISVVKPLILQLKKAGFWLSDSIIQQVLTQANEA